MEKHPQLKKGQISFTADRPMEMVDADEQETSDLSATQKEIIHQLGSTTKAYLDAAEKLLQGQYAHIKEWTPAHLSKPGNVLVTYCPDGVAIRFEPRKDKRHVIAGWCPESLTQLVPLLSQHLIHCNKDHNCSSTIPTTGMELRLSKTDSNKMIKEDIISFRIGFDVVIERPETLPKPPNKPFCLLSVRNLFELQLGGVLARQDAKPDEGQKFIARTVYRLPIAAPVFLDTILC